MFTAVSPPRLQLTELEDFLDASGISSTGLRWVAPDKWHITLSFMPAVEAEQVGALHDALTELATRTPPLDLRLSGAGSFARSGAATPMWIGVDGDLPSFIALAAGSLAACHRSGARVESSQHFRPHLTVSRHRPARHGELWLEKLDAFRGTPWTVSELLLIESTLGGHQQPARYSVVERHPLRG
ncbi:RNA 2',3'-cyclic phosphodiesterase [Tessaracoccus antarcticus]|nr:RNA 2',3'-cyclic phosphodiesterase [Tessaracoccus antarcticus]